MLFGVAPADPLVFTLVVIVTLVASLAASVVPARRATRVSPVTSLRT
jgi:ABC-type lipoprotein release transport system permease subunit